jgi:RNA polymerase sigma-70 factor (ECF subfamily)
MSRGDSAALAVFLERYWPSLVRYATGLLGNRDDAEDVAIETFERLWERRDAWQIDGSVLPLLLRIARNLCLDCLRRRATRDRVYQRTDGPPCTITPDAALDAGELRSVVTNAVDSLPERRREALLLTRMHGLSRTEVAQVMGLSPQTVANHLQLAMNELRQTLAPYVTDSTENPTRERADATA